MDTTTGTPPLTRAGRREWTGLAVLALPTLLIALDIGVLFLALPHLSADLDASGTQQLWITDSYGFMLAGFLITMGTLGDRIGRRKLLLIGAAAFGAASVLAAYSTSADMLIATRALLGVAGATLGPSTLALISTMFRDEKQRGVAISLWATCQFGGAALGPVIGGVMLEHFWWGSVFLLGVPVMVVLLVVGPRLLPEARDPGAGRIDLLSVTLSLGAVLPVVYGIKELAVHGFQAPAWPLATIAVGGVVSLVFVRRQRMLTNPLLDLALFRQRSFSAALAAMTLGSAALAGIGLMTTQYVQSVVGLSPAEAGVWQAPTGLGIAAGVMLAPVVVRWIAPVTAIAAGAACSVLGLLVLARTDASSGVAVVSIGVAVVAFGVGPVFVLGTGLVVGSVPPERAGAAASVSETSNLFGSTMGLAVLGSVGAAVYGREMTVPAGVPEQLAETARETVAGAAAVSGGLPGSSAAELVGAAREAFTAGLNVVAVISAVLVVVLAAVIVRVQRRR